MNKYKELRTKHQQEVNVFQLMFAFSDRQFTEGMKKLGLTENDTNQIVALKGTGRYMRKSDVKAFDEMTARHNTEMNEAIANDVDGTGFIKDMFSYELNNHEYGYTMDVSDTLDALGYTMSDIDKNKALANGLELAKKKIRESCY